MRQLGTHRTYAEMIHAQLQRAKRDDHGVLWTTDRFGEAKRPLELGLRGSLEIAPDRQGSDSRLRAEKCDPVFRGLSVFAFPRLCRYIARGGFGESLVQEDIANSQLRMIYEHLTSEERERFSSFCRAVLRRKEMLAYLQVVLNTDVDPEDDRAVFDFVSQPQLPAGNYGRDECKQLILAILYGASLQHRLELLPSRSGRRVPFLEGFAEDVCSIADLFAARYPHIVRKCEQDWKKKKPKFSCLSYLASSWQRDVVDRMKAAVGDADIASEERLRVLARPASRGEFKNASVRTFTFALVTLVFLSSPQIQQQDEKSCTCYNSYYNSSGPPGQILWDQGLGCRRGRSPFPENISEPPG